MTSKSKDVALSTVGVAAAVVGCVLAATPPRAVSAALACSAWNWCYASGSGYCNSTPAHYVNGTSICICDTWSGGHNSDTGCDAG